jgi:hypothetical protein
MRVWAIQWGRILAPDELSIGEHTLRVVLAFTDEFGQQFTFFDQSVTFTVYPAESEACTL